MPLKKKKKKKKNTDIMNQQKPFRSKNKKFPRVRCDDVSCSQGDLKAKRKTRGVDDADDGSIGQSISHNNNNRHPTFPQFLMKVREDFLSLS